jgi:tetratricopeptide (TPR) repeat protein
LKTIIKYLLFVCFLSDLAYSQNTESISKTLKQLQQKNSNDTTRIGLYLTLASEYISFHNDSAFYYLDEADEFLKKQHNPKDEIDAKYLRSMTYYTIAEFDKAQWSLNQTITLAKANNDKRLLARSYNLMGAIQFNLGNYPEAIRQYNNKLQIVTELRDTISIIETYYNISLINNAEGSYFKSLENNYTALGLSQKIKDTVSMMIVFEGLGVSYSKINELKKAIDNLNRALNIAVTYGKTYEEAGICIDLGNTYQQMNLHEKALYYFKRAGEQAKKSGDKLVQSMALSGKGVSLMFQNKNTEAIEIFTEANSVQKEIGYPKGIAENELHIANCYFKTGNYKNAKQFAMNSLREAQSLGEKKIESEANKTLSNIYDKFNNADSAYYYFKKFVQIADTLNSRTMFRKISAFEAGHEKEKREESEAFEIKTARTELLKQKQIRNTVLGAVLIVLVLLIFSYHNYRKKQKANIEITEKKKVIEHKNKDILDSINYSKRLQDAVLMSGAEVREILPGSLMVYLPKEIVSGDFYFIEKENDVTHIALADSTKHGVPGAFMSIAGYNVLKQALKEKNLKAPGQRLDFLNTELKSFLRNDKHHGLNETINLSYCIINESQKIIQFAGANHPAWISSENKRSEEGLLAIVDSGPRYLYEIASDKEPIGLSVKKEGYKSQAIKIQKGDRLFLFTNGFSAQTNQNGNEYGHNKLAALLNNETELTEEYIINEHINWKSTGEQSDDICIIGIRF